MSTESTVDQILNSDSEYDSDLDLDQHRRKKKQKITVPKSKLNKFWDENEPTTTIKGPGDIDEFKYDGESDPEEEEIGRGKKNKKEDKDTWVPVTFSNMMTDNDINWEEEKREHPARKRSQDCYACRSAIFHPNPNDPPELYADTKLLLTMIKQCTMNVSTNALIDELYKYFNKIIRKNMIKHYGEDPGPWSRKDIYNHLFYHMVDPGLEIRHQIDVSRIAMRNLTNRFETRNEDTGEIKTNPKNMDQWIKFGVNNTKILKDRPEKNINFNPLSSVTSGGFKLVGGNKRV